MASIGGGLTEEHAASLRERDFVVVDGFLLHDQAKALQQEALGFARGGGMPAHRFQFGPAQFVKPNIFEADLHDDAMREALPELAELYYEDSLQERIAEWMPELSLGRGPGAKSLKLQHNRGSGGCFPLHYDNAGRPSKRVITCVVYLNDAWREGDGGELVLQPFLHSEVSVAPLLGRAAIFRSDRVLHRVLPATRERLCFTIWLDGDAVNSDADCNLTSRHLAPEAWPQPAAAGREAGGAPLPLCRQPVQRAVSRAVYAEAYEESLRQCMAGAAGCEEMLQEHLVHVAKQQAHPQLSALVAALRSMRA